MLVIHDGVEVFVLPDGAKCRDTGKSPFDMSECPCGCLHDGLPACYPGECPDYSEVSYE